jgi:hypothetical protein
MADNRIILLPPVDDDDDDKVEYLATLSPEEARARHSPTSVLQSVAASAASAAAPVVEPNNMQRRSNREVSTTIVYVDGQPIKRANMYQVKGMSYVYESTEGMAVTKKQRPKKPPMPPRPIPLNDNFEKKSPPALSQREIDRLQRKQDIGKAIMAKVSARHAFLSRHVDTLRPFLDDKVYARISDYDDSKMITKIIPPVLMQPDCITAELRDYQLIGLDWMHQMYQQNIGMILGDGMYDCVLLLLSWIIICSPSSNKSSLYDYTISLFLSPLFFFLAQKWGWVKHYKRLR